MGLIPALAGNPQGPSNLNRITTLRQPLENFEPGPSPPFHRWQEGGGAGSIPAFAGN